MKNLKYLLVLTLAFTLAVPGCKKFELDTDELILSADLSVFKTIVNFTYYDATSGEMIAISPTSRLKIEVISPVSGLIVNTMGKFQTVFTPNYGFFSFSLNPYSTVPTAEKPISILVKTMLNDYIESIVTINLSEERIYNQEVKLINVPVPPAGVIIEEHDNVGTASKSGETQEGITINTSGNEVGIQIEAGTTLKDESGLPLTGNVSIEVMSVDVSSEEGYKNVPGLSQPIITEDGTLSSLFSPIAYTRVGITDDSGRKAATVTGKDITIITALHSAVINPATRRTLAEGDLVPSYYFDSNDGNWKFFGKDTVSKENGQLQLIKVIKSKKSTGDENFSEITYSFDQDTPLDVQVMISLPAEKPTLPTAFNAVVTGFSEAGIPTELFNHEITLFTLATTFTINNLSSGYASYSVKLTGAEMVSASGETQLKTMADLAAGGYQFTFGFTAAQFKDPTAYDGPTRLYLQFACVPTSGSALFMDSPYLPNSFYLIFSGTDFTGETILQIQGGSFIVPFNPMLQAGGTWQAKVVMGSMEYPAGSGRVNVTNADFQEVDGKIIFKYSPETAEQCDDFKTALGIN